MIWGVLGIHLEHVLSKYFLILISEPLVNNPTELREVYETIPSNLISKIYYLLLHGVQAKHLHGCMQVLTRNRSQRGRDIQL